MAEDFILDVLRIARGFHPQATEEAERQIERRLRAKFGGRAVYIAKTAPYGPRKSAKRR